MLIKAIFKINDEIVFEKKEEPKNILESIKSIGEESISEIQNKIQKGKEENFISSERISTNKEKEGI